MAGDAGTTAKVCGICKLDCSARPRTKDAQGRYFCKACLDKQGAKPAAAPATAAKPRRQEPTSDPAELNDQNLMAMLVDESLSKAAANCPGCRRPFKADAVLCTHCGFNRQTAQVTQTQLLKAELPKEPGVAVKAGKVAAAGMSPVFALAGAGVGGLVGGGLWYGIGYAAHLEIGYVAWLVGFLAGCGAKVGAGKYAGLLSGLIAVVVAIASILGARWLLIDHLISEMGGSQKLGITADDAFMDSFDLMDIVFMVLAIGSAAVVGSGGEFGGDD